jgi:hypothetical protein
MEKVSFPELTPETLKFQTAEYLSTKRFKPKKLHDVETPKKIRRILWYRNKVLAFRLFFDFIQDFLYFRIIISVISFFPFSFMKNLTYILFYRCYYLRL